MSGEFNVITTRYGSQLTAIGIWALAWWAMLSLAAQWDFANLAMILLLASTLAAVLMPAPVAAVLLVLSVLAFNWFFMEPRGSLALHLQQHRWFWLGLIAVNVGVLTLMAYLRHQLAKARQFTAQLRQLNAWHQVLLEHSGSESLGAHFLAQLHSSTEQLSSPLLLAIRSPAADIPIYCLWGPWQPQQLAGVEAAQVERRALGPGTGCYERWQDLVLPIVGRHQAYGALVAGPDVAVPTRRHWQLMCHQLATFCDRERARRRESAATAALEQERTSKAIIAAVAHDFRTPLATIIAASSALLAQADLAEPERRKHVQRILQQAQHLSSVSQNLLQLARLGAEHVIGCDWESVEEMLGSLLAQLPYRQQVHITAPQNAPLIWCNGVLINQALFNLLENAQRYGPRDGSIVLRAQYEQPCWQHEVQRSDAPDEQPCWQFEVQDQGMSLSEEQAEQLQSAFLQGREGGHPSGVGLGLALCRAIAKAHQGALSFTAEPSSTWRLRLPQPQAPAGLPP